MSFIGRTVIAAALCATTFTPAHAVGQPSVAAIQSLSQEQLERALRPGFDAMDDNSNGMLTADEIPDPPMADRSGQPLVAPGVSGRRIWLETHDGDRDGMVSWSEYRAAAIQRIQAASTAVVREVAR